MIGIIEQEDNWNWLNFIIHLSSLILVFLSSIEVLYLFLSCWLNINDSWWALKLSICNQYKHLIYPLNVKLNNVNHSYIVLFYFFISLFSFREFLREIKPSGILNPSSNETRPSKTQNITVPFVEWNKC